jgi:hypothetical protein
MSASFMRILSLELVFEVASLDLGLGSTLGVARLGLRLATVERVSQAEKAVIEGLQGNAKLIGNCLVVELDIVSISIDKKTRSASD